jgi:hypothetical protein
MSESINTTPRWLTLRDRDVYDRSGLAADLVTDDSDIPITDEADAHVTAE